MPPRMQREQITPEKICNEETIQWTVTMPLYNIGEHVYNLSDEFKKSHPEIPWIKIAGLRHRLVHHYEDTNWIVICAIVFDVLRCAAGVFEGDRGPLPHTVPHITKGANGTIGRKSAGEYRLPD